MLAPGLLCDDRVWAKVRARLSAPTFTVSFSGAASLDAMAQAILAAAPARFVLAGFSMGAMAAMLAAARAPERIAALVIVATHAEADTPERAAARLGQIAAAATGGFTGLVAGLTDLYFFGPASRAQEGPLVCEMAYAQGPAIFSRHARAILDRPDLAAVARRIAVPAAVVGGAQDRVAPPQWGRRLADLVPGADWTMVRACGHMSPLEASDAVADVIRRAGERAGDCRA